MNMNSRWVEVAVLPEAAFLLSTSSSVNRYVRLAKSLAKASALADYLESGLINDVDLLNRCRELRNVLAAKKQRDVEEIELAVIMAILADVPTEAVSDLLLEFSVYDQSPLTWISALARKLVQDRAFNIVSPTQDSGVQEQCLPIFLMGGEQFSDLFEPKQPFDEEWRFEMPKRESEESLELALVAA